MIQTGDAKHPKLSLIEHIKDLADMRVDVTRDRELMDVLTIALCTLLCAGESFNDMEDFSQAKEEWFRTFLTLKNGIPSHDAENLATSRKLALNLLKGEAIQKRGIQGKQLNTNGGITLICSACLAAFFRGIGTDFRL